MTIVSCTLQSKYQMTEDRYSQMILSWFSTLHQDRKNSEDFYSQMKAKLVEMQYILWLNGV